MRPCLLLLSAVLLCPGAARAQGLLVPEDKTLPPLSVVRHQVHVTIDEQVATTKVEQTFRNAADRPLEATYVFPVPKGASVHEFAMWVDGKKLAGEMVPAEEARKTYTEVVRRTQDPALLEYAGNNLLRLRVFPIAPHAEQKVTLTYTSVAAQDAGAVQYIYPLKAASEGLSLHAVIKSKHGVQSVYSPSHAITVKKDSDHEAHVSCEPKQGNSDKDFQLFYSLGDKDVGLTALTYRPVSTEDGHFLMLLTPKFELAKTAPVPRDVVLVLDTSGSMAGVKIQQAKKALDHCLRNLNHEDRFAVINFCSTVNKYRDHLVAASSEHLENAQKWVNRLEATSGTNINEALQAALEMRSDDHGRSFTVVFFTDGMPTEGVTDPEQIVKNVMAKNTAETRIFTFGVGDDVNAALLDQLAEQTRAVSTFVRPNEDIEAKASALYDKISHPVLTNLKLKVDDPPLSEEFTWIDSGLDYNPKVQLSEVYPPHLPDLFHGGQLVVLGRYSGHGAVKVTLTGSVGKEKKEFVFETTFAKKTNEDKAFVEQLWARRKVGYLLDQIRANGEKKELVDEVKALARKHGIATPYSSFLIAPDAARAAAGQQSTDDNLATGAGINVSPASRTPPPALFADESVVPSDVSGSTSDQKNVNAAKKSREPLFQRSLNEEEEEVPSAGTTATGAGTVTVDDASVKKVVQDYMRNNPGAGKPPSAQTGYGVGGPGVAATPPPPPGLGLGNFNQWSCGIRVEQPAAANRNAPAAPASAPAMPPADKPVGTALDTFQAARPRSESTATPVPAPTCCKSATPCSPAVACNGSASGPAAQQKQQVYAQAAEALRRGDKDGYQSGRVGVELALQLKELRDQSQLDATAVKRVGGRNLRDVGGVWLDDTFDAKMTLVEVKALSAAYFRILERHPEMAQVFQLGKRVVWVTPSGAALVVAENGKDKLDDAEIDRLFVAKK
jgi:Ca-activated chloride channel family protein